MRFKSALLASLILTSASTSFALDLDAKAWVVGHVGTNTVVDGVNADQQLAPASLTKLMTLYMLFDALKQGRLALDSELPISEKAWRMGGSKMFVEVGKKAKVEDLIKGIIVSSGNDACVVVAEYLGGTEEGFAELMQEKARNLGMAHTTFKNANGWPNPEQLTTARDMFVLGRSLVQDFPEYYDFFNERVFTYSGIKQYNRNGLLRRGQGVDGMKTGHTEESGFHLVASAKRDGARLVSVVMGTDSMQSREDESMKALNYVFSTHKQVEAVPLGVKAISAPVWLGTEKNVPLITGDALTLFVHKNKLDGIKAKAIYNTPVKAPIQVGQVLGKLEVSANDEVYNIPLVAGQTVPALEGMDKFIQLVKFNLGL